MYNGRNISVFVGNKVAFTGTRYMCEQWFKTHIISGYRVDDTGNQTLLIGKIYRKTYSGKYKELSQ